MALLKKKRKREWNMMERPSTMDYTEALKDPGWDNERRWADKIMASNRRLVLDYFKLDKLTKGEGSCFPIAVVHTTVKQRGDFSSFERRSEEIGKRYGSSFVKGECERFHLQNAM